MTTAPVSRVRVELQHQLTVLPGRWPWFLILGATLATLGFIAVSSAAFASIATAVVIGWLLLMAGGFEMVGVIWCRGWSGFFHHLLAAVLSIVVGMVFIRAPVKAALDLTLLLAVFLWVAGVFKIIAVLSHRFTAWGWPLLSGIIDLVLGVMIWREWPGSALWVIGTFVGISLLFRGFNWIGLGMALRAAEHKMSVVATPQVARGTSLSSAV